MKKQIWTFVILLSFALNGCQSQNFAKLFDQLNPSIVTIQSTTFKIANAKVLQANSLGSGVLIDKDGLVMTAAHVVESASVIQVKFLNGETTEAEVISSISSADVALLKVKKLPANPVVAKMGNSDGLHEGEDIMVIGAPFGLEHSLSIGHMSGRMSRNLVTNGNLVDFIQTDASINHGNSGGPMFNKRGEVIGIVSFILSEGGGFDGIGFGVSINAAKKILFDQDNFWGGFDGFFLNENLAGIFNVPQKAGVLLQRVRKGTLADKLGLKGGMVYSEILGQKIWIGGDIILNIQGVSCEAPHDITTIKERIEALQPGDDVIIKVLRRGKVLELMTKWEEEGG